MPGYNLRHLHDKTEITITTQDYSALILRVRNLFYPFPHSLRLAVAISCREIILSCAAFMLQQIQNLSPTTRLLQRDALT
ncbi:hypothetical protein AVEN_260334-1, partial [Araneus ventricosus]